MGPSPTATSSVVWPWINPQQHGFAPRYDTGTGPRGLTGRLLLQEEAGPECPAGGHVGCPDQVAAPRSSLCPRENWGDLCPKPARLQPSETLVGGLPVRCGQWGGRLLALLGSSKRWAGALPNEVPSWGQLLALLPLRHISAPSESSCSREPQCPRRTWGPRQGWQCQGS